MMFKNSLKLFCSNFDKVWKLFFYSIIVTGIAVGLIMPFFSQVKDAILSNWTVEILDKIPQTGLLYGKDIAGLFTALWDFSLGAVKTLFVGNLWIGIYISFIVLFVYPFLMNIGKYVVNEMLYSYMSSQAKVSFCAVLVKTLRKSTAYSALRTLMMIPFIAIVVSAVFGIASITAPLFAYFLPVVVVVGIALVTALLQTFLSGWAPASVVYGFNVCKSYNIGIRAVFRRYGRSFSTLFVLNMIFIFLIMGFGLVSAFVFIPFYMGMINMFEMVMFFGSQGMRYYADADTVLSPKKLEQLDNIKKTKYLL